MAKTSQRQLGYEPDPILARRQMSELVLALNRTKITARAGKSSTSRIVRLELSEMQIELDRLVTTWRKSGPNLRRMFRREPELDKRSRVGKTFFFPSSGPIGYLDWIPLPSEQAVISPKDQALEYFMTLITNPQWELLGRPCSRCGDHYLKKTKRQKAYCSRVCSSMATAIPAVKLKRQTEHANRISKAQAAVVEWSGRKRSLPWKDWVSNRTRFTVKWITRAVNNGSLKAPDRQR
jgi:hypothetical protein